MNFCYAISLMSVLIFSGLCGQVEACSRSGAQCWKNDWAARDRWCESNGVFHKRFSFGGSWGSTCYCCDNYDTGIQTVRSYIPNYLPSIQSSCTFMGSRSFTSGQSHSYSLRTNQIGTCRLNWGSASLAYTEDGRNRGNTFNIYEDRVTSSKGGPWYWSGTKPQPPTYTVQVRSLIGACYTSFQLTCTRNGASYVSQSMTAGKIYSFNVNYLDNIACTGAWGSARVTWSFPGSGGNGAYDVDTQTVVNRNNVAQKWSWTGTKPQPPSHNIQFTSLIQDFYPNFQLVCTKDGVSFVNQAMASAVTKTVATTCINNVACTATWGSASVRWSITGTTATVYYDIDEQFVKNRNTASQRYAWTGRIPDTLTYEKTITSYIPSYLPNFEVQCKQNTTTLTKQTIESGKNYKFSFSYYSRGECTAKWGTATVNWPILGNDKIVGFNVFENSVRHTRSGTWNWIGTIPQPPNYTFQVKSLMSVCYPSFQLTCTRNGTSYVSQTMTAGKSYSFTVNYLNNIACTATWASASVSWSTTGKTGNGAFDVDIQSVTNRNNVAQKWNWSGTKPQAPSHNIQFKSVIQDFYPNFRLVCTKDGASLVSQNMDSGTVKTVSTICVNNVDCTATWGSASARWSTTGFTTAVNYDIDEQFVRNRANTAQKWAWTGRIPDTLTYEKTITSHIPAYLPSFEVQCKQNTTTLAKQTIESGKNYKFSFSYFSRGECTAKWATATVTWPVLGNDKIIGFNVFENAVKHTRSGTWNWIGTIPQPPNYTIQVRSLMSVCYPSFQLTCTRNGTSYVSQAMTAGKSYSFTVNYLNNIACTATWASASVSWSTNGKTGNGAFDVDIQSVTNRNNVTQKWNWSGTKPQSATHNIQFKSLIQDFYPNFRLLCTKNGASLVNEQINSGAAKTVSTSCINNVACTATWGSASAQWSTTGFTTAVNYDIDEQFVRNRANTAQKWAWTGRIPDTLTYEKTITSHIPSYLPSFEVQCKQNTTTLTKQTIESGRNYKFSFSYFSRGECTVKWGTATVTWPVLGNEKINGFNVFETSVRHTRSGTWNWSGTIPQPPNYNVEVKSLIPDYYPSFRLACTKNGTNFVSQTMTSDKLYTFQINYLNIINCTTTWGTATVNWSTTGKLGDLSYEADVQFVKNKNNAAQIWAWGGRTPDALNYQKTITSQISPYFPIFEVQCKQNNTNLPNQTIESGKSYKFSVNYFSLGECTANWGTATATWPVLGNDRTSGYNVLADAIRHTTANEAWNWTGTIPGPTQKQQTITSKIPNYFPTFVVQCSRNSTQIPQVGIPHGGIYTFDLDVNSYSTCLAVWGNATVVWTIDPSFQSNKYDVSDKFVQQTLGGSSEWLWSGTKPLPLDYSNTIKSFIPDDLPSFQVQCEINSINSVVETVKSECHFSFACNYFSEGNCTATWGTKVATWPISGRDRDIGYNVFPYGISDTGSRKWNWTETAETPETTTEFMTTIQDETSSAEPSTSTEETTDIPEISTTDPTETTVTEATTLLPNPSELTTEKEAETVSTLGPIPTNEDTDRPEITTENPTSADEESTYAPIPTGDTGSPEITTENPTTVNEESTPAPIATDGDTGSPEITTGNPTTIKEESTSAPIPTDGDTSNPEITTENPTTVKKETTFAPISTDGDTGRPEITTENPTTVNEGSTFAPIPTDGGTGSPEITTENPTTVNEETTFAPIPTEADTGNPEITTKDPTTVKEETTLAPIPTTEDTGSPEITTENPTTGNEETTVEKETTQNPTDGETDSTRVTITTMNPSTVEDDTTSPSNPTETETDLPDVTTVNPTTIQKETTLETSFTEDGKSESTTPNPTTLREETHYASDTTLADEGKSSTTTDANPDTTPENDAVTGLPFACDKVGLAADPYDCFIFHQCVWSGPGINDFVLYTMNCPSSLVFCEESLACDYNHVCPCNKNV